MVGDDNSENVVIWEAIAGQAAPLIDRLWDTVAEDIPKDNALRKFQNSKADIGRLQSVMTARAQKWTQAVYDICAEAWKKTGKPMAPNFDRAIWTFEIGRFIEQRLEELLLRAAGSPPSQRTQLRTWQRQCCEEVKGEISKRWWNKLMMGRTEDQGLAEAAGIMAAMERETAQAIRMVSGLPPTPAPPTLSARVEDIAEEGPALNAAPSAVVAEEDHAHLDAAIPTTEAVDLSAGFVPKEIPKPATVENKEIPKPATVENTDREEPEASAHALAERERTAAGDNYVSRAAFGPQNTDHNEVVSDRSALATHPSQDSAPQTLNWSDEECVRAGVMFLAIEKRLRGLDYCSFLYEHEVCPPQPWIDDEGCPDTYPKAYQKSEKWRDRIHKEKSRKAALRDELEHGHAHELERILTLARRDHSGLRDVSEDSRGLRPRPARPS